MLRDLIQRQRGAWVSLGCIAAGIVLSAMVAPPSLVIASAAAFGISELADFAIYTPLWRRSFVAAVIASCAVGATIDSAAFLLLAFGSLDHLAGQIVGKLYAATIFMVWRLVTPSRKSA